MNVRLNTSPVCLARRQAVTLTQGQGTEITCRRGSLWITQDGDPRDIVLQAGESFTLDRGGPAIVWALRWSFVEMVPPRRNPGLAQQAGRQFLRRLAFWPQHGYAPSVS